MKKLLLILTVLTTVSYAQDVTIPVPDNLIVEGIPPLPMNLAADVRSYTESRGAALVAWHPLRNEMMISTRFANSVQLHYVKSPGGDRRQVTFFDEPVGGASFEPTKGDYFVFGKDIGGNEFVQLYRYDMANKKVTLLTDGKRSQNGGVLWNNKKNLIAYNSTKRNGADRDIYLMNPLDPASDKKVVENVGGGWGVVDWSPDDSRLLVQEGISVNETRLYIADAQTGVKTRLLPEKNERSTFRGLCFSKDGSGIYLITNRDNEFNRLAYFDIGSKKLNYITRINWDVDAADMSVDEKQLVFKTNENGASKLYILDVATHQYVQVSGLPTGVIGSFGWSPDSKSIGVSMVSYNASADVFEYKVESKQLVRWTESELGGMDISKLQEPELIVWKSFDGKMISGYLYKASANHVGKRPVIVNIHGGPEGQALPVFQGRLNYYLNELGISIIFPNVRGSTGYGKTFVDLDNGLKREASVKDIGALLDWIATQPHLDKDRVMVTGGSYGGYMTLAVAYMYNDRIRCSLDVVGISNFNTFMKNTEAYRQDLRRVEYGDERDPKMAEFFEKTAPMNHTDKINKPMFIVQGGNDPRVPYTESVQMKEKIAQNGGTVWFLMAKDEGHGFKKKNNVDFQFYSTIAFVKQYLLKEQPENVSIKLKD